jgi:hypothetical protein
LFAITRGIDIFSFSARALPAGASLHVARFPRRKFSTEALFFSPRQRLFCISQSVATHALHNEIPFQRAVRATW